MRVTLPLQGYANPAAHEAVRIELPILVAVGPELLTAVVVVLVGEPDGDTVRGERQQFPDEPIVQLSIPPAREEGDDLVPASRKFGAVSPRAIGCVGESYEGGVAAVPAIFG